MRSDLYFNPRCVSHYYNTIISYHILSTFYVLAKQYSTSSPQELSTRLEDGVGVKISFLSKRKLRFREK